MDAQSVRIFDGRGHAAGGVASADVACRDGQVGLPCLNGCTTRAFDRRWKNSGDVMGDPSLTRLVGFIALTAGMVGGCSSTSSGRARTTAGAAGESQAAGASSETGGDATTGSGGSGGDSAAGQAGSEPGTGVIAALRMLRPIGRLAPDASDAARCLRWALRTLITVKLPVDWRYFGVNHYQQIWERVPGHWEHRIDDLLSQKNGFKPCSETD